MPQVKYKGLGFYLESLIGLRGRRAPFQDHSEHGGTRSCLPSCLLPAPKGTLPPPSSKLPLNPSDLRVTHSSQKWPQVGKFPALWREVILQDNLVGATMQYKVFTGRDTRPCLLQARWVDSSVRPYFTLFTSLRLLQTQGPRRACFDDFTLQPVPSCGPCCGSTKLVGFLWH